MKKYIIFYLSLSMMLGIACSSMHASSQLHKSAADISSGEQNVPRMQVRSDLQLKQNPWGTSLHKAVFDQNIDKVMFFIDKGQLIDALDLDGFTPLHRAVMYNSEEIVKALIDAGADLTILDNTGCTPLLQAVAYDKVAFARMLIAAGSSLETRTKQGFTPLALAVHDDRLDMVKMLIENGALNYQDPTTPRFKKLVRSKNMRLLLENYVPQDQSESKHLTV